MKTGKSAVVTIQDRGPYVEGRIVDLSPATAQEIGITRREGVTKVEVAPITVPQPDGSVKLGRRPPSCGWPAMTSRTVKTDPGAVIAAGVSLKADAEQLD